MRSTSGREKLVWPRASEKLTDVRDGYVGSTATNAGPDIILERKCEEKRTAWENLGTVHSTGISLHTWSTTSHRIAHDALRSKTMFS